MIFFLIKKLMKFVLLVLLFITVFLLSFLLIGSTDTAGTYSSVYLTKLEFNQSSELYSNVQAAYKGSNISTKLAEMTLSVGYLGVCVDIDNSLQCTSYNDLDSISDYTGISIIPTTKNGTDQLNLVTLAKTFRKVCYSNVLLAAIVLSLLSLLVMFWNVIPLVPGKAMAKKIACVVSAANVLVWGLGSMLQHEATKAARHIIGPASMNTVSATIGQRAEAMTWTAFSFLLIVCMGSVFVYIRDLKEKANEMEPKF